jgi:hypothetical protein
VVGSSNRASPVAEHHAHPRRPLVRRRILGNLNAAAVGVQRLVLLLLVFYYAIQFPTVANTKLLTRHSGQWNGVVSLSFGASRMCPCLVRMTLR